MSSSPAVVGSVAAKSRPSVLLPRFAWGVLVYNVLVVLWGAVVRATSSGAGCGDHWPLCNGVVVQSHPRLATSIELAHRMSAGVTVIAVLLLLIWVFRRTVAGHLARITVVAAAVFIFNESLLGALLVLLRLTADNRSPARAVYLSLHLVNTLLLLGALALTAHFLSRGEAFDRHKVRFKQRTPAITGLVAILIVGASGTLAALSDTLFPAGSVAAALAADFSNGSSWLQRVRFVHPVSAVIAGLFIGWLLLRSFSQSAERRPETWVLTLLAVQCLLGVADMVLLTPLWMQILHLLGADLLWIALIVLTARVCVVSETQSDPLDQNLARKGGPASPAHYPAR
jgi:cytochrome c oxidase assembly protein subunit 15